MFTQKELMEYLSYDPETGIFKWLKGYRNRNVGKIAGFIDHEGYRQITFKKRIWRAHHLAWFYVHGEFPKTIMDHKDGIKDNNAIDNLREVTFSGNSCNQRKAHKDSTYGLLGADFNKNKNRFRARIQINGKRISLGGFATAEEAHEAYLEAKRRLHSTCTI